MLYIVLPIPGKPAELTSQRCLPVLLGERILRPNTAGAIVAVSALCLYLNNEALDDDIRDSKSHEALLDRHCLVSPHRVASPTARTSVAP